MDAAGARQGEQRRYRLNENAVAADIFDGEAVLMHLEHGTYYGLDKIGADIWQRVLDGWTAAEISAAIAGHFGMEGDAVAADVEALVAQMFDENLVLDAVAESAPGDAAAFRATTYQPPKLSIYRDMKNLLAFDPPLPDFSAKDFQ